MLKMRFQTKLTFVYLALFLTVQSVVILSVYTSVTKNVQEQIEGQLLSSGQVIDRLIQDRAVVLGERAVDVSNELHFRQALGTGDSATIVRALGKQSVRLSADAAFVIDLDDNLLAAVGAPAVAMQAEMLPIALKVAAEDEGFATSFIVLDGRAYEIALAPVVGPVTKGWIGFALELDKNVLVSFQDLAPIDLEMALLSSGPTKQLVTAINSDAAVLSDLLLNQAILGGSNYFSALLDGQDYLFRRILLNNGFEETAPLEILIYYSVETGLWPFRSLVVALISILSVGLVLLFIGSLLVSRGITRPLRRLARAAQKISAGDYQEVTSPANDEEIYRLTNSFNQMITAVRDREERITYEACHDSDSGLPNRIFFEEKITPKITSNVPFSLAVVEIQNLADLRAVLTHEHISELVRAVAHRLNGVNISYLAQLSTDTYAFAHFENGSADTISSMIINSFAEPMVIDEIMIDVRVCIGLTKSPADGKDLTALLRNANSALDNARSAQQGYGWYSAEHDLLQKDRLSMMAELRDGLATGEVQFHYQPKLDLGSGRITSVEALVHWFSPARGLVPSDDFVSLAEKTGDIRLLTNWGLNEAVQQIADWQKDGIDLSVAVNLSTNDLMNVDLPNQILNLLKKYSVPAALLKLEVTESAVMTDMARALDVLNMLSAMGLELSIDDYGTGYSSLSYIKSLPVREIKIDKSFVIKLAEDDEDKILVRSTIELAHNLGLQVTAEGVENQDSVELLRSFGCDRLQGFHICRPIPGEEIKAFLQQHSSGSE